MGLGRRGRSRKRRSCRRRAGIVVVAAGRGGRCRGAVAHVGLRLGSLSAAGVVGVHEDVRDGPALRVLREHLVLVVCVWELGDDVARVDKTGDLGAPQLVSGWGYKS